MYRGPNNIEPAPLPLTAQELMWLHGLTVEQGLRQGYCIVGHEKEWREARRAAKAEEQKALRRAYGDRRKDSYTRGKTSKPEKPASIQVLEDWIPIPRKWRQTLQKNTPERAGRVSGTPENTSDAIHDTSQTQTEVFTNMDKNTRILLLIHLMSSETFAAMPQTEKAILLTELLYGKDKPEAAAAPKPEKKTGGRPKKAAPAAEQAEDVTA